MEEKIKKRIDSLISEINNHNYAYYVLDDPKLSDRNMIAFLENLRSLKRNTLL